MALQFVSLQNKMTHPLLVCKAFHNLENSFISHKGFQFLTSLYEEKSTQLYHKIARWPITSWKCPFWLLFFFSGYCCPNSILLQLPGLLELEIYHVHLVIKCELTKKKVNEKKFFFLEKGSHVVQGWPKMVMTLKQLTLMPGTEIKLTFVQAVWASSKKIKHPSPSCF